MDRFSFWKTRGGGALDTAVELDKDETEEIGEEGKVSLEGV